MNLAMDALEHGFVGSILFLEEFDELLRSYFIGQRPKPSAGTPGKQHDMHTVLASGGNNHK